MFNQKCNALQSTELHTNQNHKEYTNKYRSGKWCYPPIVSPPKLLNGFQWNTIFSIHTKSL